LREIDAVKARHAFGFFNVKNTYNAEKKMKIRNSKIETLVKSVLVINKKGKTINLDVVLEAGQSFYNNDYDQASTTFDYATDSGCNPFIIKIQNDLCESDFDELEDDIFQELKDMINIDVTKDDLLQIYLYLNDLRNEAQQTINDQ